jgi:hypothetical protein
MTVSPKRPLKNLRSSKVLVLMRTVILELKMNTMSNVLCKILPLLTQSQCSANLDCITKIGMKSPSQPCLLSNS